MLYKKDSFHRRHRSSANIMTRIVLWFSLIFELLPSSSTPARKTRCLILFSWYSTSPTFLARVLDRPIAIPTSLTKCTLLQVRFSSRSFSSLYSSAPQQQAFSSQTNPRSWSLPTLHLFFLPLILHLPSLIPLYQSSPAQPFVHSIATFFPEASFAGPVFPIRGIYSACYNFHGLVGSLGLAAETQSCFLYEESDCRGGRDGVFIPPFYFHHISSYHHILILPSPPLFLFLFSYHFSFTWLGEHEEEGKLMSTLCVGPRIVFAPTKQLGDGTMGRGTGRSVRSLKCFAAKRTVEKGEDDK